MRNSIYILVVGLLFLNSCHIYRNYQRPEGLPVDSLYRQTPIASDDSLCLGDLPWQELFQDSQLQQLIQLGLENNTDMQIALLRVDQARSQLQAARLSFLPSLSLLPIQASWEIDLFGKLRNAKQETQAALLQQEAYQQAVRSDLIANIANSYYTLLLLDDQIDLTTSTLDVRKEQVRLLESRFKVGEETENAVTCRSNYMKQKMLCVHF